MFRTKAGKVRRLDVIFATYEERAFCILGSGSPAVPIKPRFATCCSPAECAGCRNYCLCRCGVVRTPSWPIFSKLCWADNSLRLPDVRPYMLQEQCLHVQQACSTLPADRVLAVAGLLASCDRLLTKGTSARDDGRCGARRWTGTRQFLRFMRAYAVDVLGMHLNAHGCELYLT